MGASPSKPRVAEFYMVIAVVRDLVRSRDFYRDVFGLTLLTDAVPHWVDFDLGDGRRLGLHPSTEHVTVHPGSLQLGFSVPSVDRFVADARSLNCRILQEPFDESFGRLAIIEDPDGYPVQVYTAKR